MVYLDRASNEARLLSRAEKIGIFKHQSPAAPYLLEIAMSRKVLSSTCHQKNFDVR